MSPVPAEMVTLYREAIAILQKAIAEQKPLSDERHHRLMDIYEQLERMLQGGPPPVTVFRNPAFSEEEESTVATPSSPKPKPDVVAVASPSRMPTRLNPGHMVTRGQVRKRIQQHNDFIKWQRHSAD